MERCAKCKGLGTVPSAYVGVEARCPVCKGTGEVAISLGGAR